MRTGGLTFTGDVSPASWLRPRLTGARGTVTSVVPAGFAAYVRICHPVPDGAGGSVTWGHVATVTGRTAHPTMQWRALAAARSGAGDPAWLHGDPEEGNLAADALRALAAILGSHSATPDACAFCLWEGYGALHGSPSVAIVTSDGESRHVPPAVDRAILDGPRVRLPGRGYLLLTGPLSAAADLDWDLLAGIVWSQSPNLFWPSDHAWCVGTEIDFDSTLVGGSAELVRQILDEPTLEAWPVAPDDALTYDADHVNGTPFRTGGG